MTDSTTAISIAIVAIIAGIGASLAVVCKVIRKSDCFGVHIETRTPDPATPIVSPHQTPITVRKGITETII